MKEGILKIIASFILQEISLRLGYYMRWPEHRMVLNDSADWSRGEINVNPDIIKNFWVPDILIHDLVRYKLCKYCHPLKCQDGHCSVKSVSYMLRRRSG